MNQDQLLIEFDRQLNNLLKKDYHQAAGISVQEFIDKVKPLKQKVLSSSFGIDYEEGALFQCYRSFS